MADLNKKHQKILDELAQKIKDPNELDFVKSKISELCIDYMASIDKILEIEKKQLKLESKVRKMEHELSIIEEDIYINDDIDNSNIGDRMHDNDYEFEITCPYCSYEFLADESCKGEVEIECPKCHNIIELDWKEECSGNCSSCSSHCNDDETEQDTNKNGNVAVKEDNSSNDQSQSSNNQQNINNNDAKYNNENINQILKENNEDDM